MILIICSSAFCALKEAFTWSPVIAAKLQTVDLVSLG